MKVSSTKASMQKQLQNAKNTKVRKREYDLEERTA